MRNEKIDWYIYKKESEKVKKVKKVKKVNE